MNPGPEEAQLTISFDILDFLVTKIMSPIKRFPRSTHLSVTLLLDSNRIANTRYLAYIYATVKIAYEVISAEG